MKVCPCCSDRLLRHIRAEKIYWFCPVCREEMPVLERTIPPMSSISTRGRKNK